LIGRASPRLRSGMSRSVPPPLLHATRRPGLAGRGAVVGFAVATATWMWVAAVDRLAGRPFHTFEVLGGVAAFSIVHYLLNLAYGVALVFMIRGAARAPSAIFGAIFGFIILEVGFIMMTILLTHVGLGALAWVSIFGGSLLGAAIAFGMLRREYPLAEWLRQAEAER
jgi:hypothetical protein